jgi:CheY-like chemotaxis protein
MASIQQGRVNNGFQTLVKLFRFQSTSSVSSIRGRDVRAGRFTMDFAQSGAGALQRISDSAGASLILILSDINMPGMTGLELLPKAKAARADVPVIMITAYGDTDTRRKALEGGAEALLTKPIDFVALRSEIDNRVAGAGAEVR